jgi:thiol-disulfide isomerase/thioredoxin
VNRRTTALVAAAVGVLAVVSAGVALRVTGEAGGVGRVLGGNTKVDLVPASAARPAAELTGISGWLNSPPLSIEHLRGRVVVVDFWTYTCINCRRTFPFLRALHRTYSDDGLTIVGVHTPEFDFEKLPSNVERAVRDLDVTWPVAEDPNRDTWDAYDNQYWPAKYLIDRQGRVRSVHIGEGGQGEVEEAIRALLEEGGTSGTDRVADVQSRERPGERGDDLTPEIYLGARRGDPFYPESGPVQAGQTSRRADKGGKRDVVYLTGSWIGAPDWATAASAAASIDLSYHARDVYALVAPERGFGAGTVEVLLDGEPVPPDRRGRDLVVRDGSTVIDVDADDLHHVLTGEEVADGHLTLRAGAPGIRFVTFTFGG